MHKTVAAQKLHFGSKISQMSASIYEETPVMQLL